MEPWLPASKQSKAPILPNRAWCLGVVCLGMQNAAQHPFPGPQGCSILTHRPWAEPGHLTCCPANPPLDGRMAPFLNGHSREQVTPCVPSSCFFLPSMFCTLSVTTQLSMCRDDNWRGKSMFRGDSSPSLATDTSTSRPESGPMFQPVNTSPAPPFPG